MTAMNFDITASDDASREFLAISAAAEKLEDKLRKLDKMTASPTVDLNIDPANRKLDQLKTRLDALKNVRTKVELDGADSARRDATDLVVELRKLRNTNVKLGLNTGTAKQDIQQIAAALKNLRNANVGIAVSIAGEDKLDRLVDKLDKLKSGSPYKIRVEVDVDDSQLTPLASKLSGLTGKTHVAKVRVDDDGGKSMSFLAKLGVALAATAPLTVASFGASTAAVASFGGAIATAVPIAVAGLGMLGGVLATVEVATNGVGAAFAAFRENDMKKFDQLMGELSANAKSFTLVLTDLWVELKRNTGAVQDQMFAGLDVALRRLGEATIPMLIRGMGGVAQELNLAAREVMGYLSSAEGIARQTSMWVSTRQVVANLRPAFADVTAILSDLGEVGGRVLADVTDGVGSMTQRWRDWIAEARNSGRLEEIMRGGVEVFQKLGSIIGNTGSILASFYRAATTAGSDFLTTLDRGTEAAARFLKSAEGQNSLVTFFRESRAAIDALMPGLASMGRGIMEAVRAFGETQGLSRFGAAVGEILNQVGQLLGPLGTLGGNVLKTLANSAALAAQVLGPVARVLLELLNATGPVGAGIIAMAIAFNRLQGVNALVTGLGASVAGMAGKLGVGESATSRIAGAFSKLGAAIPILGVALVGIGIAYEELGSKADQSVQRVIAGSMTMQQAIAEETVVVERQNNIMGALASSTGEVVVAQDAAAAATANVSEEFRKQYAALSPYQKLQADVAMAQAKLNDAVAQFGPHSSQAVSAAAELAAATERKRAADEGAAGAARSHSEAMRDQVQAAQQLLGSLLAVEDALAREAEAMQAANAAVAEHGEGSAQAQAALNDYAQAADQAAQAVGQQAEAAARAAGATDPAAQGTRAYGAALLQLAANASGPAQSALLGYISKLSDAQLAALSAGAEATGFATKIMQLPDGRVVKIAVDPETGKIVSTQQLLDAMQKTPVMIKIGADTVPADQAFQRVLTAVQQGKATVEIDGQNLPALEALAQVGREAGLANATVNIQGQTVSAQAALDGFITSVKTGNPTVNIGGRDFDARQVFAALQSTITGSNPTANLKLNTSEASAAIAGFRTSASAQVTIPVGANGSAAMGTVATVRSSASQPATMPVGANGAGATQTIAGVRASASAPATMPVAANTSSAQGSVNTVQGSARTPQTMPVAANTASAAGSVNATQQNARTPQTFPLSSNTSPATGPINSVHSTARQPQTFTVNANTGGAMNAVRTLLTAIPGSRSIVITITRIFQTIGQIFENGGVLPMASGGIVAHTRAYDSGGADDPDRHVPGKVYDGHRLTPMSGQRAAEVGPRTYRVIGDRQRDTEVFIPLNGSKASLAFTAYAAAEQGFTLTPLRDRSGGDYAGDDMVAMHRGGRRRHRHHRRRRHHHRWHRRHPESQPAEGPTTSPSTGQPTPPAGGGSSTAPPAPPTAAVNGTYYTTSQVSTTQPFVQPAGSVAQPPASTTPTSGGGIDLSALIAEVRAVKAAVLATGPNNADVVAAVGRVERAIGTRRNVAATAQHRRCESELSRI